ncbi:hypothetical protein GCM10009841_01420 [Microlunatus panaciterrae]|uniref:Tight adherence protein B n=1 Tax=Microlunatus panaciterrae TaxID=400768 RepID=A0ABS2RJP1_9ACTN|nr:type II secretion system F family protein [Microlunatus panaciterrae]MBM7799224.1 tight adherence protein B [Microlunatus panaciterrae]
MLFSVPLLGLLLAVRATAGSAGVVSATAAVMVGGTTARLVLLQRRSRLVVQARTEVAQACSVLAGQSRIGAVPEQALLIAAADCRPLVEAAAALRIGGDVVETWRHCAHRPGQEGLADLARAWQISRTTGAELATALEQVSVALDADRALDRVVRAELAAARATGRMLAVLPAVGLALGFLIGGDPLGFLLGSPYGWGCLLLGVGLACFGVLWMERISAGASERW